MVIIRGTNRRVNIEFHLAGLNAQCLFWHNLSCTVDHNRHNRCTRINRQKKTAFFKRPQAAVAAPRSFRKYQYRYTVFNFSCGGFQAKYRGTAIGPVNADITGTPHRLPK